MKEISGAKVKINNLRQLGSGMCLVSLCLGLGGRCGLQSQGIRLQGWAGTNAEKENQAKT